MRVVGDNAVDQRHRHLRTHESDEQGDRADDHELHLARALGRRWRGFLFFDRHCRNSCCE
jgi:hypothetical protein